MDPGLRSPLLDFFRRGEVARDIRVLAARGALAPRALEQLGLLLVLLDDADAEVAAAARATVEALPAGPLAAFLSRSDVPTEMRAFFVARGVVPAGPDPGSDEPLVDVEDDDGTMDPATEAEPGGEPAGEAEGESQHRGVGRLASLTVMQKMKVAMRGTREERAVLIRDPNRIVAAAVLSSPKVNDAEVEQFARMPNVAEDVLRVIGTTRSWVKNYTVAAALVRNPKTPLAISLHLLARMSDRDTRMLSIDKNVPEPLRIAARKKVTQAQERR